MAPLITPEALERERLKHARKGGEGLHVMPYGVSGWRWADSVMALVKKVEARDVLDYGAGRGTLSDVLRWRIPVRNYDPVTFPEEPEPADIVVCTDVLEQIEPDSLDDVLAHIHSLARKAVLIVVPRHSECKANIDRMTTERDGWWIARLKKHWPRFEYSKLTATPTRRFRFIGYA